LEVIAFGLKDDNGHSWSFMKFHCCTKMDGGMKLIRLYWTNTSQYVIRPTLNNTLFLKIEANIIYLEMKNVNKCKNDEAVVCQKD
jgi:hypothetical protein